ncbi:hypothetical protein [Nonomuraea sp. NPDC023979]|uniref:hypothetical protein n=1 Tax=Nonomuraea sp. NPDC023979 TaxID=3154796 RepID=UPI0033F7F4A5
MMRKAALEDAPTKGAAPVHDETQTQPARRPFGANPLRSAFVTLLVVVLALTVAPGTASAGGYDLGPCKSGMVCLHKNSLADADMIKSSYVSLGPLQLSPNTHYYIVNNGKQQTGYDHYYFEYAGVTKCLHYNVGSKLEPGAWVHLYSPAYHILVDQRWGGECP